MLAGKYLKPYQGLKHDGCRHQASKTEGRKIPKTLSGIETDAWFVTIGNDKAGKYLKPYQGLKPSGIDRFVGGDLPSRKIPKTLSGIETFFPFFCTISAGAGKYLKPYQGLKRGNFSTSCLFTIGRKIPKTLSGIET